MSKEWIYILIIILFSFVGMKALFHPGLFTAHDIWHQVVRFYYYSQAINDGQFPPYWISQLANRFGYPLFFFSYHLPWMIGTLLIKIGFDFFTSIKALFLLSYIASGIFMYFFVKSLLKNNLAALTSSILYLWLPYHFMTIFVGASMGIAFVFTFTPIIFWGIHLIGEKSRFGIPILSIGISGVILSHIMHLIFLTPTILLFTLWVFINNSKKIELIKKIVLGLFLSTFISAFYLIPAFYYSKFTKVFIESGFSQLFTRNFITFKQLLYSTWGFGPIINNAKNSEISFQLGIAHWISITILIITIFTKRLSKNYFKLTIFLILAFIVCVALMLDFSKPIWQISARAVSVDFPFRLLLPATFIASICTGIVIANARKKTQVLLSIFLVLAAIYTNRNHLRVNQYTNYPILTYLESPLSLTTNTFNEYLPLNADPKLLQRPWNEITGTGLFFLNTKQATNFLSFDINALENQKISVGQFYFPGQTLYLDNRVSLSNIDNNGLINFEIPKGVHTVTIRYEEPLLIKLSKVLSSIGIFIILLMLTKKGSEKKFTLN